MPWLSPEAADILLRLAMAALVGLLLGLNRSVTSVHYPGMAGNPDATSRILQGIIHGIMTGVGFFGAGVIFRERGAAVRNLTTAATVWVTAALGVACALAAWQEVWIGFGLSLLILLVGGTLERATAWLLGRPEPGPEDLG